MQKNGSASKAELLTEERGQSIIGLSFAECSAAKKSMTASLGPGSLQHGSQQSKKRLFIKVLFTVF